MLGTRSEVHSQRRLWCLRLRIIFASLTRLITPDSSLVKTSRKWLRSVAVGKHVNARTSAVNLA